MARLSCLPAYLLSLCLWVLLTSQPANVIVYVNSPEDSTIPGATTTIVDGENTTLHSLAVTSPALQHNYHPKVISKPSTNTVVDEDVDRWINKTVRKWGCHRKETPLIFVHIGKAGGGMIRARFAAAAHGYNRNEWYAPLLDQHYYPVHEAANASFCNSAYKHFTVPNNEIWPKSFEGQLPCNATTPIGIALACPEAIKEKGRCRGCQQMKSKHCHTVYMGHNHFGSELHWLPPKYLQNWWRSTAWKANFSVPWKLVYPPTNGSRWCSSVNQHRPTSSRTYQNVFENCSIPIGRHWDAKFLDFWRASHPKAMDDVPINFSPIYASLPVQRVTMVREPWSWLVSKFFWHHDLDSEFRCDDLATAIHWAHQYTLQGVVYLCGEDCGIRWLHHQISFRELWIQSESNLRHAFSVVGLMNETLTFFEMLTTRVAYLDMSLNPNIKGERHRSGRTRETVRCHRVFQDPSFQQELRTRVPMVQLLEHLYHVAVEVNRNQLQELRECQGPKGSLWKRKHFH